MIRVVAYLSRRRAWAGSWPRKRTVWPAALVQSLCPGLSRTAGASWALCIRDRTPSEEATERFPFHQTTTTMMTTMQCLGRCYKHAPHSHTGVSTMGLTQAHRNHFFQSGGVKVKSQFLSCNIIRWFSPHPLKSCWLLGRRSSPLLWHLSDISGTLTSAPHFRGSADPPDPTFLCPWAYLCPDPLWNLVMVLRGFRICRFPCEKPAENRRCRRTIINWTKTAHNTHADTRTTPPCTDAQAWLCGYGLITGPTQKASARGCRVVSHPPIANTKRDLRATNECWQYRVLLHACYTVLMLFFWGGGGVIIMLLHLSGNATIAV